MTRFAAFTLCLFGLLLSPSALAFLDGLDTLEQDLDTLEDTGADQGDSLDNLLKELEDAADDSTTGTQGAVSFSDVPSDAWFHNYVSKVAEWGIVSGFKDAQGKPTGRYGPGDPVTVAQMLKIAMEAAKLDTSSCGTPRLAGAQGHWAAAYVACGEQRSLRVLTPNADINRSALRGEVLGIIHDVFGDTIAPAQAPFNDTAGHPYEMDIAYAVVMGIVSGDKDSSGSPTGTYRPNDGVNRAEAAKIIYEKLRVSSE